MAGKAQDNLCDGILGAQKTGISKGGARKLMILLIFAACFGRINDMSIGQFGWAPFEFTEISCG